MNRRELILGTLAVAVAPLAPAAKPAMTKVIFVRPNAAGEPYELFLPAVYGRLALAQHQPHAIMGASEQSTAKHS